MNPYSRVVLASLICGSVMATGWATDAPAGGGAKVYAAKCATCHGKDGKGNPAMAKVFKVDPALMDLTAKSTQDKKDDELILATTNGKNKMPAYKGKVSDADIKDTVAYVRTLAAPAK